MHEKFIFPRNGLGFHLVIFKAKEAEYFLENLNSVKAYTPQFKYNFSAFVTALRSVTFVLQKVMNDFPGFEEWYKIRQEGLKSLVLAKAFVEFRNLTQKVGIVPIEHGYSFDIQDPVFNTPIFILPTETDLQEVPVGNVRELCIEAMKIVFQVAYECYKDFGVYLDPKILFSEIGLQKLNWDIQDLEIFANLSPNETNIKYNNPHKSDREIRFDHIRSYSGPEETDYVQEFFNKYFETEISQ